MALIPAGTFNMGSAAGAADEQPVHAVTLRAFFMDQFEVTNERYKGCVDAGDCTAPGSGRYTSPDFANHPVLLVSWEQAQTFCTWEGKRLPTEAEWEYAATGGDGRIYPWGNEFNLDFLPARASNADASPVGSFPENVSPFGVFDMAGNAVEWVADWYARGYYAQSEAENPPGPATGTQKVMRGGSFGNPDGSFYTTTRRYRQSPGFRDVDIGFRCAADMP
jgi:formylglycine-generating enzyme required for sulfatase activity